jgi:hypothetical protein
VFLPAGGAGSTAPEVAPEPAAEEPSELAPEDDPNHWVKAEQALVRELRELSQGKGRK